MKFGMMHFDLLDPSYPSNFHILKIQYGGGRHLELESPVRRLTVIAASMHGLANFR